MFCVIAFGLPWGICPDETISGYADPAATYVLEEMSGVPAAARATIRFPETGLVTGEGPCNAFRADQGIDYPWIAIDGLTASRMACPDLAAEAAFFAALEAATLAEVSGDILLLSDDGGVRLTFRAE